MKKQTKKQYEEVAKMLDEIQDKTGYDITWQGDIDPRFIKSGKIIIFQQYTSKKK